MSDLTPQRETQIRSLDLLTLMDERSASVISGHLAVLLAEIDKLREKATEMQSDCDLLNALEMAGVDNWEGYDMAREAMGD